MLKRCTAARWQCQKYVEQFLLIVFMLFILAPSPEKTEVVKNSFVGKCNHFKKNKTVTDPQPSSVLFINAVLEAMSSYSLLHKGSHSGELCLK